MSVFIPKIEPLARLKLSAAPIPRPRWGAIGFFLLIGLLTPWMLVRFGSGSFYLGIVISIMLWAVVAQAWHLILGVAGIYSFAQIAILAIGGWVTGVLTVSYGWNPWLSVLVAALAATLASLVIGIPSLRLRGIYVVLLTLSFHELLANYVTTGPYMISGGGYGIVGVPHLPIPALSSSWQVGAYYIALVVFVLATWSIWWIMHSPVGYACMAMRDSEAYAASRGINQFRVRLVLFAFSGFLTGLAGAVLTHYQGSISPSIFEFTVLINVFAMIVIGGWGNFLGPIVGAVLLITLEEVLTQFSGFSALTLGILLVLMVLLAPLGIWPAVAKLGKWLAGGDGEPDEDIESDVDHPQQEEARE